MKTMIVGISGKARHGKNQLAEYVKNRTGINIQIYSFAAALKAYCRINGWMKAKDGYILQVVGTDLMRHLNENVLVDALKYQIDEEAPRVALITDCRFPNEIEFCKKNGLAFRIERLNADGSLYISDDRPADHPSETALDGYGADYFNGVFRVQTGDYDGLFAASREISERIKLLERMAA